MSLSRARRRDQCELADWFATDGARGGYRRDAGGDAKAAHALKGLQSVPGLVGVAVHDAFAALTRAIRDGRRPPGFDELFAGARRRLNEAAANHDAAAWLANPRRPFFRERLYGEWPGGDPPRDLAERTTARLSSLLRRLLGHPMVGDLHECGRGDVLVCDALDALLVEIAGRPVRVYAAPDVVYVARAATEIPDFGVPVPAGTPVLADVKSGGFGRAGHDETARDQLCVYAWFVQTKLGVPPGPLGYLARLVDLSAPDDRAGDIRWALGPADVDRGRRLIERAVADLASKAGPDGAVPIARVSRSTGACRFCNFPAICVDREDAPPPVAALLAATPQSGTYPAERPVEHPVERPFGDSAVDAGPAA